MHLSRGQNRRASAALSYHHRKTFRSNDGSHLSPSSESPDMRQLDLQEVRRLFFKHRERIFRGTDALLSGDGNPNCAPESPRDSSNRPATTAARHRRYETG